MGKRMVIIQIGKDGPLRFGTMSTEGGILLDRTFKSEEIWDKQRDLYNEHGFKALQNQNVTSFGNHIEGIAYYPDTRQCWKIIMDDNEYLVVAGNILEGHIEDYHYINIEDEPDWVEQYS